MDLSNIREVKASQNNRSRKEGGVMTVIYSQKNGKRIEFKKEFLQELSIENELKVAFDEENLYIGRDLPNISKTFSLKSQGKKAVIYSAQLAEEIIQTLRLKLDGKVSVTLTEFELDECNGVMVAGIGRDA